jgi:hypothetical protein
VRTYNNFLHEINSLIDLSLLFFDFCKSLNQRGKAEAVVRQLAAGAARERGGCGGGVESRAEES